MMKEIAYYNGKVGTPDELMVPFNDRVHFFGDGVYEATSAANHVPYLMQDHLDRLYSSANMLDIKIPVTKQEMADIIQDLLDQVEGETHFIYWQVTRGTATRNHIYTDDMVGNLWVTIRPNKLNNPNVPVKLMIRPDTRFFHCNIKTLNLLPPVMLSTEAKRLGYHEAVLHRDGVVTECAHSNVSILKNGVFYSHPNDEFILRGIAKTHMIQACYRLGIPVIEKAFTLDQLWDADEIIVTSSSNFCLHADILEGKPVGGKAPELLKKIQDEVLREFYEYTHIEPLF